MVMSDNIRDVLGNGRARKVQAFHKRTDAQKQQLM
jgi:hypothetical protein